jgi:geranylgeranyl diphosphate synthase, type II
MSLPQRFSEYKTAVDAYLDLILPPETVEPEPIHRAMRYSLFAGGKRLRPLLCLACAESLGGRIEDLIPVAAAIEMIHTYSLIHDDLPSMDNDDLRRGRPTNHKVFGEAIAILAGDALLTASFETIVNAKFASDTTARVIAMLAQAAGTQGMIGGQVLDMRGSAQKPDIKPIGLISDEQSLERLHSMKTGAMIRFSTQSAAIVLEKGQAAEEAFGVYGEDLGLAFQIVDDILDVEGKSDVLGKTAGKDREQQKLTYPALLGIEASKKLAQNLVDKAVSSVAAYDRHGYLKVLAEHILEREK